MKKSLTFLASLLLAGGFVLSESAQAAVTTVLDADYSTTATDLVASGDSFTTAEGDENFYTVTVNANAGISENFYTGALSGNLNLKITGSSCFSPSAPMTFKGTTFVESGTLVLAQNCTSWGEGSMTLHGSSVLHTGNHKSGTVTLANDFYFGTSPVLNPGWSKTLVLTGKLADESGVTGKIMVQSNNGAVRFSPSDGKIAVSGGVVVDGAGYKPMDGSYTGRAFFGKDVTFESKLTVNGFIDLEGHSVSVPDFAASTDGVVRNSTGTGTFKFSLPANSTLSTPVNFDGTSALVVEKDFTGGTLALSGKGTGNVTLKAASGTLELGQNTANTSVASTLDLVTGTEADHATAKVTGSSAKQISGSVLMGDYAVFDLNGHDQTVATFYSSGKQSTKADDRYTTGNTHSRLTNSSSTPATLTFTNSTGNRCFDGTISGKVNVDLTLTNWYFLNGTNSEWDGWLKVSGSQLVATGSSLPGTLILNGTVLHNGALATTPYNCKIQLTQSGGTIMAGWNKNMTMNGVISDAESGKPGKLTIKADGGIVILTAKNTYTGGTFFTENTTHTGKLRLDVDDALPAGGDVTFSSEHGHYIDLNGHTASIGKLNSTFTSPAIKNGASTQATLKVGYGITDAAASATYAGKFTDSILLEKVGAGTQVLTGSSTTLNAKVTAGVLELAGSTQILKDVEVAGGTLKTTGTGTLIGGTVKMTSGTLDACGNNLTIAKIDGAGGTLTNTDSEHTSVYTIKTTSEAPKVKMAGNTEFHFTGGAMHWAGDSSAYSNDVYLENTGLFYLANEKALGTGTIHLNANMINESISPTLNNKIVLEGTANGIRVGYGADRVVTLNGEIYGDYALNLNSGEQNAGIVTLNGANTYTGGTNLLGNRQSGDGTPVPYVLGNDQAFGTGAVNVKESSVLQLNATNEDRTISNPIVISTDKKLTVSRTGTNQAVLNSHVTGAGTLIVSPGVTFGGTGEVSNLTLSAGSVYEINLNELKAAGVHDVLTVTDDLAINSDVTFKFVSDAPADLIGWEFNYLNLETPKENWAANVTFDYSEAGDASLWFNSNGALGGALLVDSSAVPEPATWLLFFVGATLLVSFRKIK